MKLFINGSNRKQNCYKILNDLKEKEDILINLSDKNIKYCLGCDKCSEELKNYCALDDDMIDIYKAIEKVDKIIIASPIYFDFITGLLKNMIDRLMPLRAHNLLKNKRIYLITVGEETEKENKNAIKRIVSYFNYLQGSFEFNFIFLRNFTSSVGKRVEYSYKNYDEIISSIKLKI